MNWRREGLLIVLHLYNSWLAALQEECGCPIIDDWIISWGRNVEVSKQVIWNWGNLTQWLEIFIEKYAKQDWVAFMSQCL